jgi:Fur family ferric uptake transcriptional regulator
MGSQATTTWTDHVQSELKAAGFRNAQARRSIVELLGSQSCALSAQDIHDRLRGEGQAVGLATVYRTLELLVEHGFAQRLDLGQGTARYERVHPSGDHHHHLVCDNCGRVTPFGDPGLERAIERITRQLDFSVAEHDVVLHGACESCR